MSVEVLNGSTVLTFIDDEEAFNSSVEDRFVGLDTDHDGLLSYSELLEELKSLRVLETHFGIDVAPSPNHLSLLYHTLFLKFDHDQNGAVDMEEFRSEMKQMMVAVGNGLGGLPVQMVLEEDSFLKKAVDRERASLL